MTKQAPDLIQRAAARLQEAREGSPSTLGSAVGQGQAANGSGKTSAISERAELISRASDSSSSRRHERIMTISPATLAANGFTLPSSGFSRLTEEFRALKRHVLANMISNKNGSDAADGRIVLVTSAREGEGKTFTAVNLALALAYEKDTNVVLMDADGYRQSVMGSLGASAEEGWLDYLSAGRGNVCECVYGTNMAGLSVLPSGKERAGIPELMASRSMKSLLKDLVGNDPRRIVIVDSLPCLASTEPSILAGLAGQTLFVVAAHRTSREEVESSLRLLHASQSVSLVLNKAEPLLAERFNGYGYGYGQPR